MTKVIKLNEKDIQSLVEKIIKEEAINEATPEREIQRKSNNFRKSSFKPYKREDQLMGIFGPYSDDVPVNVISYMRKNPALVIKRLEQVYGRDEMLRYLGITE